MSEFPLTDDQLGKIITATLNGLVERRVLSAWAERDYDYVLAKGRTANTSAQALGETIERALYDIREAAE